jgi:hypothetical protein
VTYTDREVDKQHIVQDLMLLINNVSPHEKAKVDFKALADGRQVIGAGSIGPVSSALNSLFVDVRLQVNDNLQALVKGDCSYPLEKTRCDLAVNIPRFSLADVYGPSDVSTGNNQFGQSVELSGQFIGNGHTFSVNSGSGVIDGTSFKYQLDHDNTKENVNQLDLLFTKLQMDRFFTGKKGDSPAEAEDSSPLIRTLTQIPFTAHLRSDEMELFGTKSSNFNVFIKREG